MRYLIFDFDGPIFDGRKAAASAIAKTVEHFESRFGRPNLSFSGLSLFGPKRLISVLYPDLDLKDRDSVCAFYRQQLIKIEREIGVSEAIRSALQFLRESGFSLAIYSARPLKDLQSLLDDTGIAQYFTSIGCGPAFIKPSGKYFEHLAKSANTPVSNLIYIGDSDWDYEAAQDGKVLYFHAGWTGEPSAISRSKADVVLGSLADLVGLLNSDQSKLETTGDVPRELFDAVGKNQFSFYAGAGISAASGIGGWEDHYSEVLAGLSASFMSKDSDLPEVLQWLAANEIRAKHVFDEFGKSFDREDLGPNGYHFAMLRSNATRIWTSNYDTLFERAQVTGNFGGTKIVRNDAELLRNFDAAHLVIKMNGDFASAHFSDDLDWGLVFLQEQFDRAERDRREVWRLFEDDYRHRSIIFVGLSFRDPVLRRILAIARQRITRTRYNHYLITRRETNIAARVRQTMLAENLQRASIFTIFTNSHEEILDLVQRIALTAYRPIVGFSGTIGHVTDEDIKDKTYDGMSLTSGQIERVCARLAEQLARKKIRVTSGGAPFVGKSAVEAAFSIDPTLARFYLRKHGGTAYRATAPAVVVPGGDYDSMRARFIPELSALVAIGGRADSSGTSGTITEVEMAIDRSIPVVLLTPAGGDIQLKQDRLRKRMDMAYKDETLKRTITDLNDKIASIAPADLPAFASEQLPNRIESMLQRLMGAKIALRHAAELRNW